MSENTVLASNSSNSNPIHLVLIINTSVRQTASSQALCSSSNGTIAHRLDFLKAWYLSSAAEGGFEDVVREQAEVVDNVAGASVGATESRDELCVRTLGVNHGVDGTLNADDQ